MENQNVPIEMWNINKRQQWTNSTVESWNSKLNNIIGKHQPNVFLQSLLFGNWNQRNLDSLVNNEETLMYKKIN
jgi:hypothetical protein